MSDIAIRVENLSKIYRIGVQDIQPRGLAQAAASLVTAPFAYLQRMRRPPTEAETFWALRDVSFEVKHGEVMGIIGRNGAGKSTLLKILSRITEPSSGQAQVYGRIASLLEVGTGFHPELTGRENIYLNGAILGMKRAEIARKFDEIVDFSGVEQFIDTPVKRYSSGMYVRLAFAVAAHLEPEILLVDEVLAVGDAEFQKKCLGKMGEVAREGRTVLFVSHNLTAIGSLCPDSILLKEGQITYLGTSEATISMYLKSGLDSARAIFGIELSKPMQILEVRSVNNSGQLKSIFIATEQLIIEIDYIIREPMRGATVACVIESPIHGHLFSTGDWDTQPHLLEHRSPGLYTARVKLPCPLLNSGSYIVAVGMGVPPHSIYDRRECLTLTVLDAVGNIYDPGSGKRHGALLIELPWEILKHNGDNP